jgi:small subunit ribosomal protein S8
MKNYFWNMFSNIKNGQLAKSPSVIHPKKKICEEFLKVLWDNGFIIGYKNIYIKNKSYLEIFLKYDNKGLPSINALKLITKPGHRQYYTIKQLWKIKPHNSIIIISTTKGLKTDTQCKKEKIGGEPFIIIN